MSRARREKSKSNRATKVEPVNGPTRTSPHSIALLVGLAIMVALMVLVAHWPALSAQALSFDDTDYLTTNQLVQNPGLTSAYRFLVEVIEPSTVGGYYQPLSMISLMLDYTGGGRLDNLRPFHRTSLALHVCNTILVIILIYSLFKQPWAAAIVGLLFGVHPLTVETIPWVGERKTLLASFFVLWCLILYVRFSRTVNWKTYVICLSMYVLALMSKPTSMPLPFLLILLDCWPLEKLNWRRIIEKIPFFIVGGMFAIITLISQGQTAELTLQRARSPMAMPLTICHNIIFYPYKMLWPAELSSVYPFPEPLTLSNPILAVGVVGTIVLISGLVISLRWTRAFAVGWLFFFVALSPTLMVVGYSLGIAADKYVYLPSIGLLLPLAWLLGRFWSRPIRLSRVKVRRSVVLVLVLILAAAESRATRRQLVYWRDSVSLYGHMSSVAPDSAPVHNGLGLALADDGKTAEAIVHYQKALQINPRYDHANYNLANALHKLGRVDEAFTYYQLVVQVNPNYYKAYNNLGGILLAKGKNDEALEYFDKALRLHYDYPEAHTNMGVVLAGKKEFDSAINHYNKAIQLKPDYFHAHYNLANVLVKQRRINEAIREYRQALQINPGYTEARNRLNAILSERGG
ncbi:MAG: tetratricopeptide repeat protein [Planctomycetota bacterium]|nr:MAG: tetratricopeptide repeat protein [Planctomycetota bacterium]